VFARLNRFEEARLFLSTRLAVHRICASLVGAPRRPVCHSENTAGYRLHSSAVAWQVRAEETAGSAEERWRRQSGLQPTANLRWLDPRIPIRSRLISLKISDHPAAERIEWLVDGIVAGHWRGPRSIHAPVTGHAYGLPLGRGGEVPDHRRYGLCQITKEFSN
jgi:hypothetical protein